VVYEYNLIKLKRKEGREGGREERRKGVYPIDVDVVVVSAPCYRVHPCQPFRVALPESRRA
jgi:hypothetical protein